jgi:hypothetical protein
MVRVMVYLVFFTYLRSRTCAKIERSYKDLANVFFFGTEDLANVISFFSLRNIHIVYQYNRVYMGWI